MKLKRTKGRKRCRVNTVCGGSSPASANVAILTVHEVGGSPLFYPIRHVMFGSVMPRSKGVPICRDCATEWHKRWLGNGGNHVYPMQVV
jgi:hypothetical protein